MSEETKDKKSDEEKTVEKRCFVMMPFSDQVNYPKGHFTKVYEQIFTPAIIKAGYIPYRVDENTISDSIIDKIFEGVQSCEMALCDLSNRNPNVLYELGLRQAYNKPVVLVKDEKTENIFDVSVISTVLYSSERLYENVLEAQDKICEALKSTGEGKDTTLVQFVRAKTASYDDIKVNEDNATKIMLQSIMKELQILNSNTKTAYYREIDKNSKKVDIFVHYDETFFSWEIINDVFKIFKEKLNMKELSAESLESNRLKITLPGAEYYINRHRVNDIIESRIGKISSIVNI